MTSCSPPAVFTTSFLSSSKKHPINPGGTNPPLFYLRAVIYPFSSTAVSKLLTRDQGNSPGWSRLMCFFSSDDVTKLASHCVCVHLYGVSPETNKHTAICSGVWQKSSFESESPHRINKTSLTCVFPRVCDERGGDGERHAAQVALVRFLPGVSALVIGQRAGLGERLAADVADVRLFPAVQSAENRRDRMFLWNNCDSKHKVTTC